MVCLVLEGDKYKTVESSRLLATHFGSVDQRRAVVCSLIRPGELNQGSQG